jgi:hypothetical protein
MFHSIGCYAMTKNLFCVSSLFSDASPAILLLCFRVKHNNAEADELSTLLNTLEIRVPDRVEMSA